VGGRVADRRPDPILLYQITAAAGLATGLIPLVSRPILLLSQTGFSQLSLGLVLGTLLAVVVLFAVPVILLGMVSPFAIRLRINETESAYNYIQVVREGTHTDLLLNEGQAIHSIYDPTTLYTHGYWDDFLLAPLFGSSAQPGRIALIGLAGGTIARQFTSIDGPVAIDGVELDPKIVEVGRRFFAMNEPNLNVIVADGRYWLATNDRRYDVIGVDAFRQPY